MGRDATVAAKPHCSACTLARKSAPSPLTGKLFDESGQSLTPSHAVKGDLDGIAYYVSRNLIKGTRTDLTGRGWRLRRQRLNAPSLRRHARYLER